MTSVVLQSTFAGFDPLARYELHRDVGTWPGLISPSTKARLLGGALWKVKAQWWATGLETRDASALAFDSSTFL